MSTETTGLTITDLLISNRRFKRIRVTQNNEKDYEIVGAKLVYWMRRYANLPVREYGVSCGEQHYYVAKCNDFLSALIVAESV